MNIVIRFFMLTASAYALLFSYLVQATSPPPFESHCLSIYDFEGTIPFLGGKVRLKETEFTLLVEFLDQKGKQAQQVPISRISIGEVGYNSYEILKPKEDTSWSIWLNNEDPDLAFLRMNNGMKIPLSVKTNEGCRSTSVTDLHTGISPKEEKGPFPMGQAFCGESPDEKGSVAGVHARIEVKKKNWEMAIDIYHDPNPGSTEIGPLKLKQHGFVDWQDRQLFQDQEFILNPLPERRLSSGESSQLNNAKDWWIWMERCGHERDSISCVNGYRLYLENNLHVSWVFSKVRFPERISLYPCKSITITKPAVDTVKTARRRRQNQ